MDKNVRSEERPSGRNGAPEAKELMHETLEEWVAYVHARIDEFGESEVRG